MGYGNQPACKKKNLPGAVESPLPPHLQCKTQEKMETSGTFKITEPCHENWNAMTPEAQGRFCTACRRCVVDFSGKSQAEIKRIYDRENGDVCGRVPVSQLAGRSPAVRGKLNLRQRSLRPLQMFALALVAAFTFLFHSPAQAQKEVVMGKIAYVPPSAGMKGRVTWDHGGAAAGVKVEVWRNGTVVASTVTNAQGHYAFTELRAGECMVMATGGHGTEATATVHLTQHKALTQHLVLSDRMIMGEMMYIPEDVELLDPREIPNPHVPEEEGALQPESQPEPATDAAAVEASKVDLLLAPDAAISFSGFEVRVFPNPTADQVTLVVEKAGKHVLNVQLVDTDGQVVYAGKWAGFLENRKTIPLGQLPAGVYLLHLEAGGEKMTRRVLKL